MTEPAYYVRGSGYEMGWLTGNLAEPAVSVMTGPYLEHIVPVSPHVLGAQVDVTTQTHAKLCILLCCNR